MHEILHDTHKDNKWWFSWIIPKTNAAHGKILNIIYYILYAIYYILYTIYNILYTIEYILYTI